MVGQAGTFVPGCGVKVVRVAAVGEGVEVGWRLEVELGLGCLVGVNVEEGIVCALSAGGAVVGMGVLLTTSQDPSRTAFIEKNRTSRIFFFIGEKDLRALLLLYSPGGDLTLDFDGIDCFDRELRKKAKQPDLHEMSGCFASGLGLRLRPAVAAAR